MVKENTQRNILFYDGTCGFCHKVIRLSNKWLKHDDVYFAALQGETALTYKNQYPEFPDDINAIVFYQDGKLYIGASAFFELSKKFKTPWRVFSLFRLFPKFISDFVYNFVATNRYNLFGKKDLCELPDVNFRKKFLI